MNNRPEYIKCIQHTSADLSKTSWCGEALTPSDWTFQNIDHAVYSIQDGSRLIPCVHCLKNISEVFEKIPSLVMKIMTEGELSCEGCKFNCQTWDDAHPCATCCEFDNFEKKV